MAKTIIRAQMKQRIDTIENWKAKNPVLLNGELGLISNDQRYKVGDGSTPWNDLPYRGASTDITIVQETGASEKDVMSQKAVSEALSGAVQGLKTYLDDKDIETFNLAKSYTDNLGLVVQADLDTLQRDLTAYVDNKVTTTLNTAV